MNVHGAQQRKEKRNDNGWPLEMGDHGCGLVGVNGMCLLPNVHFVLEYLSFMCKIFIILQITRLGKQTMWDTASARYYKLFQRK